MKKFSTAALGLALLAPFAPAATAHAESDPSIVVTGQGAVRGTVGPKVRSFQGIPYATAERFAEPRPAAGWTGVRDAVEPGKVCAQPAGPPIGKPSTDEDCLALNVTAPIDADADEDLPVIVWIHGGIMMYGMGDLYGPDRLASDGAVVVSMNYRMGVTSFLTHPSLPESGNLAIKDQRAALRWVRRNIGAFGGDARNVTVVGESAGGMSVCAHLASPASTGLFDRAIIQSAPCDEASRTREEALADSDPVVEELTKDLPDGVDIGTYLREVDIEKLLEAYGGQREPRPFSGTPELPLPVGEALRTGRFNRVPVLLGVNHDEENGMVLGAELAAGKPMADEEYEPAIRAAYPRRADHVLRRYPLGDSAGRSLARVRTDSVWSVPTLDTTRALSRRTSVRMYEFAAQDTPWYAGMDEPSFPAGAQHMSELAYIFDLALFEELSPEQAELGARMIGAWTRFAATGDPNGGGEAAWPRFRDDRGGHGWYVQSLKPGAWERADFVQDHRYRFWNRGERHGH